MRVAPIFISSATEDAMIARINRTYTIRYRDSGQVTTYVEWTDHRGRNGRTEGKAENAHMQALLARAAREGIEHTRECWG
jgi:hypothetical protein